MADLVNVNEVVIDQNHELYLHHSDHPSYMLCTKQLDGDDYGHWKQSCEVSLMAKNKLGFVKGTIPKPAEGFPLRAQWERCDCMGNILMMDPTPGIAQTYHIVLQEEKQRAVHNLASFPSDATAMSSQQTKHSAFHPENRGFARTRSSKPGGGNSGRRYGNLSYSHYKMNGHTIDKCYKLHGYPPDYKGNRSRRIANCAQVQSNQNEDSNQNNFSTPPVFTQDQYQRLLDLLNKNPSNSTNEPEGDHSAFLAGKDICLFTSGTDSCWILDSGATDHITPDLSLFTSYEPIDQPTYITIPNGTKARALNKGIIKLTNTISLSNVFHVPDF